MNKTFIPIILGTARVDRESEKVAQFIMKEAGKQSFETKLIDVKDHLFGHTIPSWEKSDVVLPWKEIMSRADGLIIISPEYNHSFPGELKILIDSLLPEYAKKPVGIVSVSSGLFAGVRMIESLIHPLRKVGMVPILASVNFGKIEEYFDEKGEPKNEYVQKSLATFFKELLWYTETLRWGRENIE